MTKQDNKRPTTFVNKKLGFSIEPCDDTFYSYAVFENNEYCGGTSNDRLVAAYNLCVELATKLFDKKYHKQHKGSRS